MHRGDSICLHCGQAAGSVFVHGHVQCLACGTVQIPCCEGASCEYPVAQRAGGEAGKKLSRSGDG
jgi:hypothetical protein